MRLSRRKAGLALLYHGIDTRQGNPEKELSPPIDRRAFARQLRHLRRRYRVVAAEELPRAVRERRRGQRLPISLTFDDDLRQHVDHAMPVLRDAGIPATFFLSGAGLAEASNPWWERVQRAVDCGHTPSSLAELLPTPAGALSQTPLDIHALGRMVEELAPDQRETFSERLLERAGPDQVESGLSSEGIRTLAGAGFVIGFHTRAHDRLTDLDNTQLERSLVDGRRELSHATGRPLGAIAYPHGRADGRVADAARRAGFEIGFTSEPTAVRPASDPLLLGRCDTVGLGSRLDDFAIAVARTLRGDSSSMALKRPRRLRAWPPIGMGRLGMRRLTPVSRNFGFDRGDPVDRYYIDQFMQRHATAPGVVRGTVLEVSEPLYIDRYADRDQLDRMEILDASAANPRATVVADLRDAPELESESFDCVICTQTLLLIYELRSAIETLHRILKPGGTLLVTVPGVSQICHPEMETWGDYWRFTTLSARRLLEEFFDPGRVTAETYGNVFTAAAFLYGVAAQELKRSQLDFRDPDYQVLIGIKAVKN